MAIAGITKISAVGWLQDITGSLKVSIETTTRPVTDDAIIDVSGNINLAQEQLDLTINANSKGLRVLAPNPLITSLN